MKDRDTGDLWFIGFLVGWPVIMLAMLLNWIETDWKKPPAPPKPEFKFHPLNPLWQWKDPSVPPPGWTYPKS